MSEIVSLTTALCPSLTVMPRTAVSPNSDCVTPSLIVMHWTAASPSSDGRRHGTVTELSSAPSVGSVISVKSCPPPALHDTTGLTDDADEHLKQTRPVDHVSPQTVPMQAHAPSPVRTATTGSDMVDASPAPQHPQLVIRPPGRHMDLDRGGLHHRRTPSDGIIVASGSDSNSDDGVVFDRPIHNITHVPDYLEWTLRSGQGAGWGGSIAGLERSGDGGGDALFIADDGEGVDCSLVTLSAGLPGGIHHSQLPDPQSRREALEAPDADGWKETMDRWVLHWKFMDGVFEINKASLVAWGNQQRPGIDYDDPFSPVMRVESLRVLHAMSCWLRTRLQHGVVSEIGVLVRCRSTTFLDVSGSVHSASICSRCTGVGTYINPSVSKLTGPVCTCILSHECPLCIHFISYSFSSRTT